ncbi:MAG: hypothetical protein CL402_08200 [Acidiferrobacteraceae bacterium]|nr:hypothetical protein [Acidiferrobacteraceae bacterium]|tara:strand:- start:30070 stop:31473 length:1404 start_codon:yes stop_codon:yes gene_type:complete
MKNEVTALVDFGSTFTKVALVELETGSLLAKGQAHTTIKTDVIEGYGRALNQACDKISLDKKLVTPLAASSAGGGLSVAAIGLVDDYTATAARQAALNAGAKVDLVLSGRLNQTSIGVITKLTPDILLFSGGTDGGQTHQVLSNARKLAEFRFDIPIIIACNSEISEQISEILTESFSDIVITANVLPDITKMNIEPARLAISRIFIEKVIMGKGLSQSNVFSQSVILPTPQAVLIAVELLSKGTELSEGIGSVAAIDIGGATTDVHSSIIETDNLTKMNIRGVIYPPLKRSVQGDLGMRWSSKSAFEVDQDWIVETALRHKIARDELVKAINHRQINPSFLSTKIVDKKIDEILAISCATLSIERHCGKAHAVYIPNQGIDMFQEGINLRELPLLIGTGGVLSHGEIGNMVMEAALERQLKEALTPVSPQLIIDRDYVLAAAGILSISDKQAAFNLMRHNLLEMNL